MHFLLTNDDGIHAPGLAALERAIRAITGSRVTVVAPSVEQSQCGHRVTTREPLGVTRIDENHYTTSGTPADCVRVALFGLALKPDFVVSGVNAGGNMGQDLYISGTVAGAREAAFHGLPAVAFSHYLLRDTPVDWLRTSDWTWRLFSNLMAESLRDGEFWNVNFPHLPPGEIPMPPVVHCHPCRAPLNVSYVTSGTAESALQLLYTATYAARPAEASSDVAVCFGGNTAVSLLKI